MIKRKLGSEESRRIKALAKASPAERVAFVRESLALLRQAVDLAHEAEWRFWALDDIFNTIVGLGDNTLDSDWDAKIDELSKRFIFSVSDALESLHHLGHEADVGDGAAALTTIEAHLRLREAEQAGKAKRRKAPASAEVRQ
jgi:hypothetical protein